MADENIKNSVFEAKNVLSGVFGVADYESDVRFAKFKMADTIIYIFENIDENYYSGVAK